MSRILRALAALALANGLTQAHAAVVADFPSLPNDSWYRVEIIVFERVADPSSTQEVLVIDEPRKFPLDIVAFDDDASRASAYPLDAETRALPVLTGVVAEAPRPPAASATPVPVIEPTPAERAAKAIADYQAQLHDRSYRPEPSSALLLAAEAGRLQRSGAYRVLLHRAWIQPVPDRDQLKPMLIQIADRNGWRVEGYLGVTRGRYLHMDTCLWYAPTNAILPTGTRGGDEPSTAPYMVLREQRRMRSGELHYLDHPKFGVLARIDPVQPPDALVTELARLAAIQNGAPAP